jgi:hypothetical protein
VKIQVRHKPVGFCGDHRALLAANKAGKTNSTDGLDKPDRFYGR